MLNNKNVSSTQNIIDTYNIGNGPDGIGFDGVNVWVVCAGDSTIKKL